MDQQDTYTQQRSSRGDEMMSWLTGSGNPKDLDKLIYQTENNMAYSQDVQMLANALRKTNAQTSLPARDSVQPIESPSLELTLNKMNSGSPIFDHNKQNSTFVSDDNMSTPTSDKSKKTKNNLSGVNFDSSKMVDTPLKNLGKQMAQTIYKETSTLQADVAAQKHKISELEKVIATLEQKCEHLERSTEDLQKETASSKENCRLLLEEKKLWGQEKQSLQEQITASTEKTQEILQNHDKLSAENQKILQKNDKLSEENQNLLTENKDLGQKLKTLNSTVVRFSTELHCDPSPDDISKTIKAIKNEGNSTKQLLESEKKEHSIKINQLDQLVNGINAVLKLHGEENKTLNDLIKGSTLENCLKNCFENEAKIIKTKLLEKLKLFTLYDIKIGEMLTNKQLDGSLIEKKLLEKGIIRFFNTGDQKLVESMATSNDIKQLFEDLSKKTQTFISVQEDILDIRKTLQEKIAHIELKLESTNKQLQFTEESGTQTIQSLEEKNSSLQKEKESLERDLQKIKASLDEKTKEYENDLKIEIEKVAKTEESVLKLNGDNSKKLTGNMFGNPALFNSLSLQNIDNLSLVDAHNIIKNVLYILEAPLSKLHHTVLVSALITKVERNILYHFIGDLAYMVYGHSVQFEEHTKKFIENYDNVKDYNKVYHPITSFLSKLIEDIQESVEFD